MSIFNELYLFISLLIYLVILFPILGFNSSERVASSVDNFYTYDLSTLNVTSNLNFSNFDNVLINRGAPYFKNILFKYENNSLNLLLSTASFYSFIVNEKCSSCSWSDKKYQKISNNRSDLCSSFYFGKISGYSESDFITISTNDYLSDSTSFNLSFISVINSDINATIKFSGALGLGKHKSDNFNSDSVADRMFETLNVEKVIGFDVGQQPNKGKFYVGGFPENIRKNLTSCKGFKAKSDMFSKPYPSCKMDYILLGDEYDFYFAKNVDEYVIFDSLSYYHVIPYDYLDYFQQSYFSAYNNCTVNSFNSNSSIFRIQCSDLIGQHKIKSVHIILNGWAYRLGSISLFDTEDMLNNKKTLEKTYFFRILFSKEKTGWTIGNTFLRRFVLGFNYTSNRVLFYTHDKDFDSYNFTQYTHEGMKEEKELFTIILFLFGSLIFIFIFLLWCIFNLKKRKMYLLYEASLESNSNTSEKLT